MRRNVLTAAAATAVVGLATAAVTTANAETDAGAAAAHSVNQKWRIHQVSSSGGKTVDKGKVRGVPFGKGKIRSVSRPAGSKIRVKFVQTFPDGKVKGTVLTDYKLAGDGADFDGEGEFTGGTGKYAGISGPITSWKGHGSSNGKARIRMKGNADY